MKVTIEFVDEPIDTPWIAMVGANDPGTIVVNATRFDMLRQSQQGIVLAHEIIHARYLLAKGEQDGEETRDVASAGDRAC